MYIPLAPCSAVFLQTTVTAVIDICFSDINVGGAATGKICTQDRYQLQLKTSIIAMGDVGVQYVWAGSYEG